MHKNRTQGFTLIEVMVALAVVSIGLLACLNAANQETKSAIFSQEKMAAYWLIKNKITEIRVQTPWPSTSQRKGTESLFQQTWHWQTKTEKTANPSIRRVIIRIAPDLATIKSDPTLEQSIYLRKPAT